MDENNQVLGRWWQRPQPAWATALISMVGMLLVLGLWNWGQTSFASQDVVAEGNAPQAVAAQATTLSYQGFVANSNGAPLNGNHNFVFNLFASSSGGTALWTETHNNAPVADGLFVVQLGSKTTGGVPDSLWENQLYLETVLNGETLTPRTVVQLNVANMALNVPNNSITNEKLVSQGLPEIILDGTRQTALMQSGQLHNSDIAVPDYVSVVFPEPFKVGTIPRVIVSPNNYGGIWPQDWYVVLQDHQGFRIYRQGLHPESWDWIAIGEPQP